MENENQEQVIAQVEQKSSLYQVTPLSKYLAMALFVILPFIGGYIGYQYAPDKVVEVEKVLIKEVSVERESDNKPVWTFASIITQANGVEIYHDIASSYVVRRNAGGEREEYKISDGDVIELIYSPDNRFLMYRDYGGCDLARGGHCVGNVVVYDFESREKYNIEYVGGDDAPFNVEPQPELAEWMSPLTAYGKMQGWNSDSLLVYRVNYKGITYVYKSTQPDEPWVLEYSGVVE